MQPRKKGRDEPLLFDLPLQVEKTRATSIKERSEPAPERPVAEQPSLFPDVEDDPGLGLAEESTVPSAQELIGAGLFDLVLQLVNILIAIGSAAALDVDISVGEWAPFAILAFVSSFVYWNVSLVFWGRTPGMAWKRLVARDTDDAPLSFEQAARRWVAAILTTLLVGLPWLATLGGRSIADRLSGSRTHRDS